MGIYNNILSMMTPDAQILAAIIIFIIAYVYAMVLATAILKYNIHYTCMVNSPRPLHTRGQNYYIAGHKGPQPNCLVTFWNLTHIVMYTVLGILCPDILPEIFMMGILFELYEKKKYECHDLLDIVYNGLGLAIGYGMHLTFCT